MRRVVFAVFLAAACHANSGSAVSAQSPPGSPKGLEPAALPSSATIHADPGSVAVAKKRGALQRAAQIRVRQVYVGANQQASLIVPDGDARMIVDNTILSTVVRVGMHYSFFNGRIKAWVTYLIPVSTERLRVEMGVSDEVGLGRLYRLPGQETRRYFERARKVPLGISLETFPGSWALSVGRMFWQFGPLDVPQQSTREVLDSVSVQMNADRTILDIVESKVHGETALGFRHVFRGAGGGYRFDKLDADIYWSLPAVRREDRWRVRTSLGQVYNITPALPLREKYVLGGAATLKGYAPQEFLGNGVLLVGGEYGFALPLSFSWQRARVVVERIALLGFVEEGRIQNSWFSAPGELKWSAGVGIELAGTALGGKRSSLRLYVAQAGEFHERRPVFYALADVK